MQFKKFNGTTWETVRHKIYGSGTEQLASFPAMIQASGEELTEYTIYGNTIQSGTPTPDAPVDVVGCGDRTAQLFEDKIVNCSIDANGRLITNSDFDMYIAKVEQGVTYIASSLITGGFFTTKPGIGSVSYNGQRMAYAPRTFTAPITGYVTFRVNAGGDEPMLNAGSTALPYEPYGYKLPLTVNGTEYPIYLGQVETTRRIRRLALTGEETWSSYSGVVYLSNVINYLKTDAAVAICTHYQPQPSVEGVGDTTTGHIAFSKGSNYRLCIRDTTYTSATTFKQYLAAQYAAGTPVTIWYVLATPETAVVNEPMHKIGDYADTISFAQAGVTIPTSDGDNTITFGTTVQPSGMSATFKGWHTIPAPKVYDGNDWS